MTLMTLGVLEKRKASGRNLSPARAKKGGGAGRLVSQLDLCARGEHPSKDAILEAFGVLDLALLPTHIHHYTILRLQLPVMIMAKLMCQLLTQEAMCHLTPCINIRQQVNHSLVSLITGLTHIIPDILILIRLNLLILFKPLPILQALPDRRRTSTPIFTPSTFLI